MKFTELQKKSKPEITEELAKIEQELMRFRAQIATGSVGKDAGKVRELRRTVARIKTIQNMEVKGKQ